MTPKIEQLLAAIETYKKSSEEAARLGRVVLYHIERDYTDWHYFDFYKEITRQLGQKSCAILHSLEHRCGKCLPCKAALVTLPSTYTIAEIRALINETEKDPHNPRGDQEVDTRQPFEA